MSQEAPVVVPEVEQQPIEQPPAAESTATAPPTAAPAPAPAAVPFVANANLTVLEWGRISTARGYSKPATVAGRAHVLIPIGYKALVTYGSYKVPDTPIQYEVEVLEGEEGQGPAFRAVAADDTENPIPATDSATSLFQDILRRQPEPKISSVDGLKKLGLNTNVTVAAQLKLLPGAAELIAEFNARLPTRPTTRPPKPVAETPDATATPKPKRQTKKANGEEGSDETRKREREGEDERGESVTIVGEGVDPTVAAAAKKPRKPRAKKGSTAAGTGEGEATAVIVDGELQEVVVVDGDTPAPKPKAKRAPRAKKGSTTVEGTIDVDANEASEIDLTDAALAASATDGAEQPKPKPKPKAKRAKKAAATNEATAGVQMTLDAFLKDGSGSGAKLEAVKEEAEGAIEDDQPKSLMRAPLDRNERLKAKQLYDAQVVSDAFEWPEEVTSKQARRRFATFSWSFMSERSKFDLLKKAGVGSAASGGGETTAPAAATAAAAAAVDAPPAAAAVSSPEPQPETPAKKTKTGQSSRSVSKAAKKEPVASPAKKTASAATPAKKAPSASPAKKGGKSNTASPAKKKNTPSPAKK